MVASIGEFTRHIGQGDWYLAANLLELAQQQTTRCDVRAYNTALSVCKACAACADDISSHFCSSVLRAFGTSWYVSRRIKQMRCEFAKNQ